MQLLAILTLCIITFGSIEAMAGQSTREPVVIVQQNPLLIQFAQTNADRLNELIRRLGTIPLTPAREGDVRNGEFATNAERMQIEANPAFARAYQSDSNETLILLRWVNRNIARASVTRQ